MDKVTGSTFKRRLLRRTPVLSKLAKGLDYLESLNWQLREELARCTELRSHLEAEPLESLTDSGVPVPASHLRNWVAGTVDLPWFLEGGRLGAQTVVDVLAGQGLAIDEMESVLDFGCGCGRVIRHLRSHDTVMLHGSDCNGTAIRWCDANLNFAEFGTNLMTPPTRYRGHSFDLIYAFSVLTHLPEDLQSLWVQELYRILKPGGHLLISVHGDYYLPQMRAGEREAYRQGKLVVTGESSAGLNECGVLHPESYVRNVLAGECFEVMDFRPQGALGNPYQDVYLLKGRGGSGRPSRPPCGRTTPSPPPMPGRSPV